MIDGEIFFLSPQTNGLQRTDREREQNDGAKG